MGWDLSEYVSLINAPTADKPYHKTYTVKLLGNVVEGPAGEVPEPAGGRPEKGRPSPRCRTASPCGLAATWASAPLRDGGVMDLEAIKADDLFGTQFTMDKAQRLDYGESLMTHAMVFQGVDLDDKGQPIRWRVENSWGKDAGEDGYYVMTDDWFTEYTYQVVVNKKYLTPQQAAEYDQEPAQLEPWDPMGSLA